MRTRRTLRARPASASSPAITSTKSSLRMCMTAPRLSQSSDRHGGVATNPSLTVGALNGLHHFRRQANDPRETALAQLAGHRAEDAGAAWVLFGVEDDHGVAIEADIAAVFAPCRLLGSDDNARHHVPWLDLAAGDRLL